MIKLKIDIIQEHLQEMSFEMVFIYFTNFSKNRSETLLKLVDKLGRWICHTNIVFTKILYFLTHISFSEGLNPFLHSTPIHFAKLFSWSVGNAHFRPTF